MPDFPLKRRGDEDDANTEGAAAANARGRRVFEGFILVVENLCGSVVNVVTDDMTDGKECFNVSVVKIMTVKSSYSKYPTHCPTQALNACMEQP